MGIDKRIGAIIPLAVALFFSNPSPGLSADKVNFALDWLIYGKHAGFYVAKEKGFYRENNLDVTIQRGYGSGDTAKRVGAGQAQFGFSDTTAVMLARTRGVKIKLIGMIHDKSMHTIIVLKGSGITKPKDLEGRKIGSPEQNAVKIIFPAFAQVNGVDQDKVEWVNMTPDAVAPSLLAGRVDGGGFYATEIPTVRAGAKKVGKDIHVIYYSKFGIDVYSNGLITTDKMIREKPDLVRRFLDATMKGVAWGIEHPEEATDIFVKAHPTTSRNLARAHWAIAVDHLLTKPAKKFGIGYMTQEKMEYTRATVVKYMKVKIDFPAKEIYTNDFLPKLFPKAR